MFKRKTDIGLSKTNLAALFFAIEVIKTRFIPKAQCTEVHVRKEDSTGDGYQIDVSLTVPRSRIDGNFTSRWTVTVAFELGNDSEGRLVNGLVYMWPTNQPRNFALRNNGLLVWQYADGKCTLVTKETKNLLTEFFDRINDPIVADLSPILETD